MVIGIGYNDDIPKAKEIIHEVIAADSRLLKDPAPAVMVGELGASSVDILVRPWVKTSEYFSTKCALLEQIKIAFDKEGISIPYPQTDVHLYKTDE